MPFIPYQESLKRLQDQIAANRPIIGACAGTVISAKFAERGGVDIIIIYNSGRYRMTGRGSAAGILAYGDANEIVVDRSEEHTSELQSRGHRVCRLLLEKHN